MSGRPSAATERALKLVDEGMAPYAAALQEQIAPSTIYRALKALRTRRRSRLTGKVIPRCHCGKAVYADGKCYAHFQKR